MDLRQLQELKRNVPENRKRFIRIVRSQDADVDELLDALNEDVLSAVDDNSRGNKIQDKDSINLAIPVLFAVFYKDLIDLMKSTNRDVAELQGEDQLRQVSQKYARVPDAKEAIRMFENRVLNYTDDVERRLLFRDFPVGRTKLGAMIKTIQGQQLNVVRSILDVGIRDGKSAQQIADDIEDYIKPLADGRRISPFTWIRDKFGQAKVKMIEQGKIPAGSVSYNAFRIARTEINITYRQAVIELNRGRKWVKGYKWNLSPSHPQLDICDEWAGKVYENERDVPEGHPHCMCYVTTELLPAEELKKLL